MQNVGRILGKYLFPALLIVIGILLLAVSQGQTREFILGGIGVLIVGILSALYVKGVITLQVSLILAVVAIIGAGIFGYLDYAVINDQLVYAKKKEKIEKAVIQRLKDIRKAQIAYKKEHGKYAEDFDTLLTFLKEGKMTLIKRLGSLPDSLPTEEMAMEAGIISAMPEGMTDEDVLEAGLIVRDTIEVGVLGYIFDENDREDRKTKLYIDSLPYVPYASHRFSMEADFIDQGGVRTPVFLVRDPDPFDQEYKVGSLTESSTSGNWAE